MEDELEQDIRAALTELGEKNEPTTAEAEAEVEQREPPSGGEVVAEADGSPTPAARDSAGKFAAKSSSESVSENTQPAQESPAVAPAGSSPQERAPITWKPQVREKWAGVDPEVRAEVARREREIDDTLRTTASARKLAEEFQRTIAPFEPTIRAANSTPMQAIQNLMQTATVLRTAPSQQKAQLVAQLISDYAVDINMLSTALENAPTPGAGPSPDVLQVLDQRLQPFQQFMQDMQNQRQAAQHRAVEENQQMLDEFFNNPENEFANDVRIEMADLLEMAAKRGQKMNLQDAYKRATLLHPQIAQIVSQRELQKQISQQTEAAKRAKQASASVTSGGAPSQSEDEAGESGSIRSALMASVKSLSR